MAGRVGAVVVCLCVAGCWARAASADAASPGSGKLRGELPAVLEATPAESLVPVSVVLAEQAEAPELARLAAGEHGRTRVAARLKAVAARTQRGIRAVLAQREAEGAAARVRPLWLSNLVAVDATPAVIRALAERPEVAWINHNPKRPVFESAGDASPDAPDWGVLKMRAPEVWAELDITGAGVVVADIDSGACYTHPDIVNQVWVNPGEDLDGDGAVMDPSDMNNVDDDGNGFVDDLVGWNFETGDNDPNDFNGHGSHTTGTVAGDGTSGTTSGMAPDARMMIVKVGLTLADEADVWAGMQYAAENGADLITMSLGWQHGWDPDRTTWRRNCDNTLAMGTIMIVAAGNEGRGNEPDNVRTPGDVPSVITIGATDSNDAIASFSSIGPVSWTGISGYNDFPYPPGLVKPDVSAPGVNTVSHNFCSGYSTLSGTSMATPHVAGTAALMLEADPSLTRDEMLAILELTAIDLGAPGKDVEFGAGRVDAYAATYEASALLRYAAHRIDDTGTDRGNGDLALDPGEIARLVVTLRNEDDEQSFSGIESFLFSETPGLRVLDNYAAYPDLGPQQTSEPAGPSFAIEVETPCFTDAVLRLETYSREGRRSRSRFIVRVGTAVPTVLFADTGETDKGWTVSGTATDGAWARGVPRGTTSGGVSANPGEDSADAGTQAFVTGNSGTTANDDDVDGGETVLTSPPLNAADYDTLRFDYARWFFRAGLPTSPPDRWLIVEASDDGVNWSEVEAVYARTNGWVAGGAALEERLELSAALRVRVRVHDGAGGDAVVEGGFDDVRLAGDRIVCDAWAPEPLLAPPPVGNTLTIEREGAHLRLAWAAPVPGPGEGPATRYSIRAGADVTAALPEAGGATETSWWDISAAAAEPPFRAYAVWSENSAGITP